MVFGEVAESISKKVPSKSEMACLVVISLGVMLAVWEESRNSLLGIVLTFVSTVRAALRRGLCPSARDTIRWRLRRSRRLVAAPPAGLSRPVLAADV